MATKSSFTIVGKAARRVEGIEKVTGQAKFTVDLTIPGMLEGKVARSPYPHALVESIDTTRAEKLPGVVAVLTRADVKDINPYFGHCLRDRPLIALDRVRYVGEPVAAVAAVDALTAQEALSLVEVKYKELPVMATFDDSLTPGAPILHPDIQGEGAYHELKKLQAEIQTNVCHHEHIEEGDVGTGFAESDRIFEDVFEFPMVYHYTMEPHAAIAKVDANGITVWSSCAHPFVVRAELALIFEQPLSKVQVLVPYVGGAYGGKSYTKIEPLVVALARKAGQPVRLEQSVPESMLTNRRHSARVWIKTGVKRDGTLVAREAKVLLDTGAYADNGPRVARRAATRIHGPYRIGNYNIDALAVYTNTCPAGSFRSIGGPQSIWALESHMDIMAEQLGIDPLEFRLKNLLKRGDIVKSGAKPMDADLLSDLKQVAVKLDWKGSAKRRTGSGVGLAVGVTDSEAVPVSTAIVRLLADGSVVLMSGSTEVGQGTRTVLCQIAAEELSVALEKVTMHSTDTNVTPFDRSTGASRSTTVMGTAVRAAAADLRAQLIEIGAEILKAKPEQIVLKDGEIIAGEYRIGYTKALHTYFGMPGGELIGRGYCRPGGGMSPIYPLFWETGLGGADVEVDVETGEIKLNRFVGLADVGKAINPPQCEGQDEGAAMMGIGHTLFESLIYDKGQPLNPNLVDYRVPSFRNLPAVFDTILVENQDGPGPHGAKGMGETGIVSPAPAIGNALARATGVRIRELPLTPERVWRALRDKSSK
ncbi:MAG: molybdopterin-dependent oxidoreductase [Deltaproteobacteria bacterium]|nr:molybdopterin-dependent oxidoreductase [Deltaproteobacteria bacterium]